MAVGSLRSRWSWAAVGVGAAAGACLAWTTRAGIADDGYITLAMARNVAAHGCWCVTPGLVSNTATSPLWVGLLAVPMLAVGPVAALAAWLVALTAGTSLAVAVLARRCGWSWWAGPVAAAALVLSPVMQAAVGLESALAVCLLAALACCAALDRPGLGGVVVGLLALTRPDLAVVGLVALVWWWRRSGVVAGAAAAVVAPWLAASLVLFGSLVPDTLAWKQTSSGLGHTSLATAPPLFLTHWPAATLLALGTLAAGAMAGAGWVVRSPRSPVTLLAVGGAAHLAVMVALGVGPFVWYLGPATGVAVILVALAAARGARWSWAPPAWRPWPWVLARASMSSNDAEAVGTAALILAGAVLTAGHDWQTQGAPFMANGALPGQYAQLAAAVPAGASVESAHGEVGTLAFFCGDRCRVVDPLSDPGRLAPIITARLASSALLRAAYPMWRPAVPAAAQYRTRYAPGGTAVWSSYSGWSSLVVEPAS